MRDRLKPQIFKYLRTAADDLAQIFMAVFRRLRFLDVLRLRQKLRAEPCSRGLQVGRMMDTLALAFLAGVAVCPVAAGSRRVEADKGKAKLTAAQRRLLHIAHRIFAALDLVGFLKPQDTDIPERQLDGFDLLRIIQSTEQNALPGGCIGTLQRALCAFEFRGKPQLVDSPQDLRIHAVTHCVTDLSGHKRMAIRVLQKLQHQLRADIGTFQAGTPARFNCFVDNAHVDQFVRLIESRADYVRQAHALFIRRHPRSPPHRCRRLTASRGTS